MSVVRSRASACADPCNALTICACTHSGLRPAAGTLPRDPDGDGRRVWRQAGFPFCDRVARGTACHALWHPIKLVYDRDEDLVATTKRHPSRTRHRTVISKEGKPLGGTIELALDTRAYATLSPVILSALPCMHPGFTSGRTCVHGRKQWRPTCRRTQLIPRLWRTAIAVCTGASYGSRRVDRGSFSRKFAPTGLLAPGDCTATGQLLTEFIDMQGLCHARRKRMAITKSRLTSRKPTDTQRSNVAWVLRASCRSMLHGIRETAAEFASEARSGSHDAAHWDVCRNNKVRGRGRTRSRRRLQLKC